MFFTPYNPPGGGPLKAESQVTADSFDPNDILGQDFKTAASSQTLFEVEDFSFDVEQTLNIGSQSSGAGAGKINFNPFSITRKIDCSTARFYNMACSGQAFQFVGLGVRRASGGSTYAGSVFVRFDFKLVAVKTISWSHDEEAPKETITFEYGALIVRYAQQDASGKVMTPLIGGWNRVINRLDVAPTTAIATSASGANAG
jgi:type VI secretion system secreted protein Hcp